MITPPTVYLVRHDTAARIEEANPILRAGELAHATHTNGDHTIKAGDGSTPYNDLPYATHPAGTAVILSRLEEVEELLQGLAATDTPIGNLQDFIDAVDA